MTLKGRVWIWRSSLYIWPESICYRCKKTIRRTHPSDWVHGYPIGNLAAGDAGPGMWTALTWNGRGHCCIPAGIVDWWPAGDRWPHPKTWTDLP